MATKSFAIPLNSSSIQAGDISFRQLVDNGTNVEFQLNNVKAGPDDELDLITSKDGKEKHHRYSIAVSSGTASTTLSNSKLSSVYSDASGGDWDYIQAEWTVGTIDNGDSSNMYELQGGRTYNSHDWPPV